jgi:heme oxygenase
MAHLRNETSVAHRRLEARLDLLRPPLQRERFLRVIARLHGFHAVWEAAAAVPDVRSRRPHLVHDLRALGLDDPQIAALPHCAPAAGLAGTEEAVLGSSYVVEGSTLGGQAIARALAAAPWLPAGGLRTFQPYGARTGEMWRAFGAWCDARGSALDWQAVAHGAQAAFAVMEEWLDP